jgi:hypothetical protein
MPRDNLRYLAEIVEAIDRISHWFSGIDEDESFPTLVRDSKNTDGRWARANNVPPAGGGGPR